MKKFLRGLLMVSSFVVATSCSLDDGVNFHYEPLQIVSAELPESFELYQTYEIKVTFLRPDDCTLFEGFNVVRADTTTRRVAVIGAVLDRETCEEVNQEVEESFQFEVRYSGTYLFQFHTGVDENGEAEYLEIEVPVTTGTPNAQ
jgi:hypothetical protein